MTATCSLAAQGSSSGGSGFDPARIGVRLREILLGAPGKVLICPDCPTKPVLRVDVGSGLSTEVSLPYQQVDQIGQFPDGKRILVATSSDQGRRSLLLVLSAGSLAPLQRVEIPGRGGRFAIAGDGYTVFVLTHRPGRVEEREAGKGDWALSAVDLGASAVTGSVPLTEEARDLALVEGGSRLLVAMKDRLLSFTTHPLRESWSYRSPGDNRRIFVRPRHGEIYVLRDASIAIFKAQPPPSREGTPPEDSDDATWILAPPVHLDRLGFAPDGRLAVGAGRGMDAMLVLDAAQRKFAGTWPEDTPAIGTLMDAISARRSSPAPPRGKVASAAPGFGPPLQALPRPGPPAPAEPVSPKPERRPARSPRGGATDVQAPPSPTDRTFPEASLQGIHVPGPVPAPPPGGDANSQRDLGSSRAPAQPPETSSLEEVADPVLSGRIRGESHLVASVILLGPDSLTLVQNQVNLAPDGAYSFDLPPPGRYRIVPVAKNRLTLSCSPAFQVVQVGRYGFVGLDFQVLGAVGTGERQDSGKP